MIILATLISIFLILLKIVDSVSIPLFFIFMILKLCGVIAWSWLLVCVPLIVFGGAIILTVIVKIIFAVHLDCD